VVILLVILIPSYLSDTSQMVFDRPTQGVFWGRVVPKYKLDFQNAKRFCDLLGATVASCDKLYSAWKAGLQKCA